MPRLVSKLTEVYTWFIAQRLFMRSGETKRVSRPAIQIATAGVAIGVAVMLISVFVVMGFKREIQNKVLGFGGHLQVVNFESLRSAESQPVVIDDSLLAKIENTRGVAHVQRFCQKVGMLKTDDSFCGVAFRGVGQEYDCTFLQQHLLEGEIPAFSDSVSGGGLLLSSMLAGKLKLQVGDKVFAYFFENNVRARRFTVAGIFETNLTEFDEKLVFADLSTIHALYGWDAQQFSGAEVILRDMKTMDGVAYDIIRGMPRQDSNGAYFAVPTIRELYPAIFNWLDLLDTNVLVILILMICVAGFTMVSGLLIIILERTNFIGVMKALGSANGPLRIIFLHFASLIILRGLLFGNLLAFALTMLQKTFSVVHLDPQTYYVSAVPLLVDWRYVLLINLATLVLCFLSLLVPSHLVSRIEPARSIRFD